MRDNFTLIYELLDECCDNGVPQITEPSVLQEYIFQKGVVTDKKEADADVTLQVMPLRLAWLLHASCACLQWSALLSARARARVGSPLAWPKA